VGKARDLLRDPDVRAVYERVAAAKQTTPFGLAMSDYFSAPEVLEVVLTAFSYLVDGWMSIRATDTAGVKSVDVVIRKADGTLVEKGPARLDGSS
jgi:hypothetical protein